MTERERESEARKINVFTQRRAKSVVIFVKCSENILVMFENVLILLGKILLAFFRICGQGFQGGISQL